MKTLIVQLKQMKLSRADPKNAVTTLICEFPGSQNLAYDVPIIAVERTSGYDFGTLTMLQKPTWTGGDFISKEMDKPLMGFDLGGLYIITRIIVQMNALNQKLSLGWILYTSLDPPDLTNRNNVDKQGRRVKCGDDHFEIQGGLITFNCGSCHNVGRWIILEQHGESNQILVLSALAAFGISAPEEWMSGT